jgi:hypothetical protein
MMEKMFFIGLIVCFIVCFSVITVSLVVMVNESNAIEEAFEGTTLSEEEAIAAKEKALNETWNKMDKTLILIPMLALMIIAFNYFQKAIIV